LEERRQRKFSKGKGKRNAKECGDSCLIYSAAEEKPNISAELRNTAKKNKASNVQHLLVFGFAFRSSTLLLPSAA